MLALSQVKTVLLSLLVVYYHTESLPLSTHYFVYAMQQFPALRLVNRGQDRDFNKTSKCICMVIINIHVAESFLTKLSYKVGFTMANQSDLLLPWV